MPPQQPDESHRHKYIEQRVRRRQASGSEERQGDDLKSIRRDRNQPGKAMLGRLDRSKEID